MGVMTLRTDLVREDRENREGHLLAQWTLVHIADTAGQCTFLARRQGVWSSTGQVIASSTNTPCCSRTLVLLGCKAKHYFGLQVRSVPRRHARGGELEELVGGTPAKRNFEVRPGLLGL